MANQQNNDTDKSGRVDKDATSPANKSTAARSQQENADIVNVPAQPSHPQTEKTAEGWNDDSQREIAAGDTGPLSPKPVRPAGPPNDWNPQAIPADGSEVMTTVGRDSGPASGQTGHRPKTVAEHNAEVRSLSEPGVASDREKKTRLP